jgi:hypothetical protein
MDEVRAVIYVQEGKISIDKGEQAEMVYRYTRGLVILLTYIPCSRGA